MAVTINEVVLEGLRRAGQTRPSSEMIKRASEVWLYEIVNEIVTNARRTGIGFLEMLDVTAVSIGILYRSRYALPADYDERLLVTLLDGDTTGTAQAGDSSTVTLAASEDITAELARGRIMLMTAGTSAGQMRQITGYNATTKVATIEEAWDETKTPVAGDTYLVVDATWMIPGESVREIDNYQRTTVPGRPLSVAVHRGEFIFDRPLDKTYGLRLRYYADPSRTPLTAPLWENLAVRWQNLLTLAIEYRMLKEMDDSRTKYVRPELDAAILATVTREQRDYGDFEGACLPANY